MILACGYRCGHFLCDLRDDQPLSLTGFYRCRTVLAFAQSIKPKKANRGIYTVEIRWLTGLQTWARTVARSRTYSQTRTTTITTKEFNLSGSIKLVVMMTAVETWKIVDDRSQGRERTGWSQVADCGNRGNHIGIGDRALADRKIRHNRPQKFRMFRKCSPQETMGL